MCSLLFQRNIENCRDSFLSVGVRHRGIFSVWLALYLSGGKSQRIAKRDLSCVVKFPTKVWRIIDQIQTESNRWVILKVISFKCVEIKDRLAFSCVSLDFEFIHNYFISGRKQRKLKICIKTIFTILKKDFVIKYKTGQRRSWSARISAFNDRDTRFNQISHFCIFSLTCDWSVWTRSEQ